MSTLNPSPTPSRSIFSRLHLIGKSRSQNLTEKRASGDSRPAATTGADQEKANTVKANVPEPTVEGGDTLPNGVGPASNGVEPIRDGKGSNIIGPRNYDREAQSVGLVRPPPTDKGTLPSFKWSFADSHIRIEEGGWARQATIREIPTSVELAGVNMRLEEGVIRELHWHKEAEWAYMLEGRCRITCLDLEGGAYEADLEKGDLWYFPSGRPHSIQGLGKGGCEFLLIFDDGNFSEDGTFLLTDWLAHTPKDVLAKNFQLAPAMFDGLSKEEKYIFRGQAPDPAKRGTPPKAKPSRTRFSHKMLAQDPVSVPGGTVRIADTSNFPVSKTVAAAHVVLRPHALRELHWHPNADEWTFFIRGHARMTIFAAEGRARTFDYHPGDIGIIPKNMAHYIENIGADGEELEFLEIFRAPKFEDFSLDQWLAVTPPQMVLEHLNLADKPEEEKDKFLKALNATKVPLKADISM